MGEFVPKYKLEFSNGGKILAQDEYLVLFLLYSKMIPQKIKFDKDNICVRDIPGSDNVESLLMLCVAACERHYGGSIGLSGDSIEDKTVSFLKQLFDLGDIVEFEFNGVEYVS